MADTKHRTTLEIDVDDRSIRGLGKGIERAFSPKLVDAFERSLSRTARTLDGVVAHLGRQAKIIDDLERRLTGGGGGGGGTQPSGGSQGGGGGGGGRQPSFARMATASAVGNYMANRMSRLGAAAPLQEGFLGSMLGGVPIAGPFMQATIQAAQQYYQDHVAMMTSRASAFGASGFTGRQFGMLGSRAARFGLGPTEGAAYAQTLARGTGLQGDEITGGLMDRTLNLQHLLGLDAGATGRIVAGGNTAGGNVADPEGLITDAVATGMEMGVRNARLDAFLEQIASFTEEARTRGINISPERALAFARAIGGQGGAFAGEAGTAASLGMMRAVQGSGDRSSAFGMMAFQAAGYGRGANAAQATMNLENNPGAVAQRIIERVRGMGGSREAQAFALRFGFREMGHELSMTQAMQLASQGTGALAMGSRGTVDTALDNARQRAGGVFGTPAAEAGFEYRRAGVGGRVAGSVQRIRGLELSAVETILPPAMGAVRAVIDFVVEIINLIRTRGLGAAVAHIGRQIAGIPGMDDLAAGARQVGGAVGTAVGGMATDALQAAEDAGIITPETRRQILQSGVQATNIVNGVLDTIDPFGGDEDDATGPGSSTSVQRRLPRGASQEPLNLRIEVFDRTQGGVTVSGLG